MLVWTTYTPSGEKRYVIQLTQANASGVSVSCFLVDKIQSGPAEAIQSLSPYILQDQIDDALCGSVFTAVNKNTGENVVVKVQDKALMDANQKERAEAEYEIAAKLNHPNIIGYLEQIDTGQHICTGLNLVLEPLILASYGIWQRWKPEQLCFSKRKTH